ncbi:MAG: trypsin-like peptidase domain-containing protein [Acidobacteria bacterium]|nr:trypsin-like peptidase domain-containing protein [Acidobacteriota bacterium]
MAFARRVIVMGAFLGIGVMAGLVIAGKLGLTSDSGASQPSAASQMPGAVGTPTLSGPLPDLSTVAEQAIKASANISSTQYIQRRDMMAEWFGQRGDYLEQSQSLGSGVIVSADGYVLTNNHVVISEERGSVRNEIKVALPGGREYEAKVIGADAMTDLALLKIDATGLTPITWGDSGKLRVAEWVLAIGNPYQFNQSVSLGIVSAVSRSEQAFVDFIQTDAAINPGNSGGALVNSRGELVGINTQIFTQTGGYQGIGFAVPSNLARAVMEDFIKFGQVRRGAINGLLQLQSITADQARNANLATVPGIFVGNLYRNSAAHRAGFLPNDLIVSVDGTEVSDTAQFYRLVAARPIGSTVKVEVVRRGKRVPLQAPVEQMAR